MSEQPEIPFPPPFPPPTLTPTQITNLLNTNRLMELKVLNRIDQLAALATDPRWIAIAKTQLELAFMSLNRAVTEPTQKISNLEPLP